MFKKGRYEPNGYPNIASWMPTIFLIEVTPASQFTKEMFNHRILLQVKNSFAFQLQCSRTLR
jgi:hypothetical protein